MTFSECDPADLAFQFCGKREGDGIGSLAALPLAAVVLWFHVLDANTVGRCPTPRQNKFALLEKCLTLSTVKKSTRQGKHAPDKESFTVYVPKSVKLAAFIRAGVGLTHNCLRHSFATYHLAANKDARLTAYLMTKTSLQSLNNDYRGRATEAEGLAWFAISPLADSK